MIPPFRSRFSIIPKGTRLLLPMNRCTRLSFSLLHFSTVTQTPPQFDIMTSRSLTVVWSRSVFTALCRRACPFPLTTNRLPVRSYSDAPPNSNSALSGYSTTVEMDVRWGDMDAFQHVNNIKYFQYFESVRIEYFQRLVDSGLMTISEQKAFLDGSGIGPILASTSCRYKQPVTFPDRLIVGTRATDISKDRFKMDYRVVSHKTQKVVADGDALVVIVDYGTGRPVEIPSSVRVSMDKVERYQIESN
eukprot:TRINITY_DN6609_c0_g1_i1.p1 TRINITY_DN6609_c0_g1~~TRINITY_DN6609_c0_g1_i1.p1  ORF type:complete len:247 (+),score=1.32 TRINITY_DN6609_c0_g1_i1:392-1132(+)